MNITLFKEITTDEYLTELEKESEKYTGLYVDMENLAERKYVKEKASLVAGLIKKIDRARIDKSRDFKVQVDNEAASIIERLEQANKPFTLLLDEHAAARKKILDEQKAVEAAKALVIEIANCHDEALLINKVFAFERAEEKRLAYERDQQIRNEAALKATQEAEARAVQAENARLAEIARENAIKLARENDIEHKTNVNRVAVSRLIDLGLTEELAKAVVTAIVKKQIPNITINY